MTPMPDNVMKNATQDSRFASRPMNDLAWGGSARLAPLAASESMDFLMRKENTPPSKRLFKLSSVFSFTN